MNFDTSPYSVTKIPLEYSDIKMPLEKITFCVTNYKSSFSGSENWMIRWIKKPVDQVISEIKNKNWHFILNPAYTSGWLTPQEMNDLDSITTKDDVLAFVVKLAVSRGIFVSLLFYEDDKQRLEQVVDIRGGEEDVIFDAMKLKKRKKRAKS